MRSLPTNLFTPERESFFIEARTRTARILSCLASSERAQSSCRTLNSITIIYRLLGLDHFTMPLVSRLVMTRYLFLCSIARLVFGSDYGSRDTIASVQTVSGTGGNRLGAVWLAHHYDFPTSTKDIYVSAPTWFNHYVSIRVSHQLCMPI